MDPAVQELVDQLDDGDLSALRQRYRGGGLAFLLPRLGAPRYREIGAALDGNDRDGLWALFVGAGIVAPPPWWAERDERKRRRSAAWIGLLPLMILLALAAVGLSRCDDSDRVEAGAAAVVASDQAVAAVTAVKASTT